MIRLALDKIRGNGRAKQMIEEVLNRMGITSRIIKNNAKSTSIKDLQKL